MPSMSADSVQMEQDYRGRHLRRTEAFRHVCCGVQSSARCHDSRTTDADPLGLANGLWKKDRIDSHVWYGYRVGRPMLFLGFLSCL